MEQQHEWTQWKEGEASLGQECRTTETPGAVSFTFYSSSPEMWYRATEFCLLGPSFHSAGRRGLKKNYKSHLCVSVNSMEAWCGCMKGRSVFFLHFTEAYIIFLLPVKRNVFSTGSLVFALQKQTKKKVQKHKK